MQIEYTDNTPALDRLCRTAIDSGAKTALMEAHRLLAMRGMHDAADALLVNYESIVAHVHATHAAQACIDKAREGS